MQISCNILGKMNKASMENCFWKSAAMYSITLAAALGAIVMTAGTIKTKKGYIFVGVSNFLRIQHFVFQEKQMLSRNFFIFSLPHDVQEEYFGISAFISCTVHF